MRYGIFFQLPVHDDQSDLARFHETLDQVVLAEALGFDSAWFAESHFHRHFSALGSPLLIAAAAAARTRRIRIGTAGILLPLHHPLRIAEEAATVDVLSGGRFELGVGRGSFFVQFEGLGISMSEAGERFDEGLEVIHRAWSEKRFSYRGKHFQVPPIQLTPRPMQTPPPVRITANSRSSTEWAAARGYPLMVSSISHPLPRGLRQQIGWYADAFQPSEHGAAPSVSAFLPIYPGTSTSQARIDCSDSLVHYGRSVGMDAPFDAYRTEMGWLGGVDEVRDEAAHFVVEPHVDELVGWFNVGGRVTHANVCAAMERFAREVRPALDAISPPVPRWGAKTASRKARPI